VYEIWFPFQPFPLFGCHVRWRGGVLTWSTEWNKFVRSIDSLITVGQANWTVLRGYFIYSKLSFTTSRWRREMYGYIVSKMTPQFEASLMLRYWVYLIYGAARSARCMGWWGQGATLSLPRIAMSGILCGIPWIRKANHLIGWYRSQKKNKKKYKGS
jgi:hypothetical protein